MSDAPAPKLTNMEIAYQLEVAGELSEVRTTRIHNRSLIAWDETRGKRQWPSSTEAPSMWQTFILYHHLTRTGQWSGTWEEFKEACVACEPKDDDEAEPDEAGNRPPKEFVVDPIQPAATPDSVSLSGSL